ncbi:hypothetical protein T492DRAFT_1108433 [Pavlovales sp. CCMP2436]|nr:hypothetical protein T492DRAFT_1108433 [Pavlovales sp. CCMP2436]
MLGARRSAQIGARRRSTLGARRSAQILLAQIGAWRSAQIGARRRSARGADRRSAHGARRRSALDQGRVIASRQASKVTKHTAEGESAAKKIVVIKKAKADDRVTGSLTAEVRDIVTFICLEKNVKWTKVELQDCKTGLVPSTCLCTPPETPQPSPTQLSPLPSPLLPAATQSPAVLPSIPPMSASSHSAGAAATLAAFASSGGM